MMDLACQSNLLLLLFSYAAKEKNQLLALKKNK